MKFLTVLLLLVSLGAEANNNICGQDAKKFCGGIQPGKGQLAKCLSDYEGSLTPACKKELQAFKSKTLKKNPCFEDLAEYCQDIPSEDQKLKYCLLKHENKLGPTCSADFKKEKSTLIVKDLCAQDIASTCYTAVSGPEGSIGRCLIRNKTKLSKFCQNSINKKIEDMKKHNPCFDDTEKYCPTQVRFMDIQECLEKKLTTLAPNCKKVVQSEIDRGKANPCYRDLRRHCKPGLNPQDQNHCLALNEKELSNACRQFRVKEDDKVQKMVKFCENDRVKLCPKAPFKDGMVLKCLQQNKAKLTKACAELM